jgi:hypothetical protein
MTHEEFEKMLQGVGESVRWRLPRDAPFALLAWNPATNAMHVWTMAEQDPEMLAAFLQDGIETLLKPDFRPQGN